MAIETIVATYRVVTPMFCGGASRERAEFRIPSFKGVLRWWWRALAWSRFGGDLRRIREEEALLFGSADKGQGRVLIRLLPGNPPQGLETKALLTSGGSVVGPGARYLGYGVLEAFDRRPTNGKPGARGGELTRPCLAAPFELKLELRCRELEPSRRDLLLDALRALGLLGGMGAKSRKGYGSLVLTGLGATGRDWNEPSSPEALCQQIGDLQAPEMPELPPYTAFSFRTRHVVLPAAGRESPLGLLDRVGREMVRFRSFGKDGMILGRLREVEGNFRDDHDLMKLPPHYRRTHPRRVAFGLPHNYGSPRQDQVGPANGDRRASPLLIHIHECAGKPVAVVSFFPAAFLPAPGRRPGGSEPALVNVGGTTVPLRPDREFWKPIHDFLDRLLDRPGTQRREPFGRALEVKP